MKHLMDEQLSQLLSIPMAPFRELYVLDWVRGILTQNKIPYFQDQTGNIVIGFKSSSEYKKRLAKKANQPLRIFIAHLDHPGFHGVKWISKNVLETKWLGGNPTANLEGSKVWISSLHLHETHEGKVTSATLHSHGKSIKSALIECDSDVSDMNAEELFGGFGFQSPAWQEDELIYTKAADDLIGVYSILETALKLWKAKSPARALFAGLLTRAEEVGFIGTLGHLDEYFTKPVKTPIAVVSLETSKTLPGAEIGKGPVVRLGDRSTVFHPGFTQLLTGLAKKLLPDKHQRRIMDGGSCEATAATVIGLPAIGISVPLGNYHNIGENGPAPEFIHINDIAGMKTLCYGLMTQKLNWNNPWLEQQKDFKNLLKENKPWLKSK
ncbi:MAG: hypothetical protein KA715_04935 [Xanthomonadaceae bacterium]|nr:hypothetical protein [Xanthomonadaceae bacterium]